MVDSRCWAYFTLLVWTGVFSTAQTLNQPVCIEVWSPDLIPSQDVYMDERDRRLHVHSSLNTVFVGNTFVNGIRVSAVAGLSSDSRSVTHLYSSDYEPENLEISSNDIYSTPEPTRWTMELKPYLDKLIVSKLNKNLQSESYIIFNSSTSQLFSSSNALNYVINATANEITDDILGVAIQNFTDVLPLEDASMSFKKGYFTAWEGWFRGLNTIHRVTDATISYNETEDTYTLVCSLSLATMKFGYGGYKAKYSLWKFKGSLDGSVDQNSASVQVTMMIRNGTCSMVLNELTVTQLDGIAIKLTGLGVWRKIVMIYVNRMIANYKDSVVSTAESEASSFVSAILASYDCIKFFKK